MKGDIKSMFASDFWNEFQKIVSRSSMSEYRQIIFDELDKGAPDHVSLFDYGVKKVTTTSEWPNSDLASYFLILSSLRLLPTEARDWSMDAMVYAENNGDFPVPSDQARLVSRYKKEIRPLLANNRGVR